MGVGVGANNPYHREAVRILILRESQGCLLEVLSGHEVVFMVHPQNALAEEFVIK